MRGRSAWMRSESSAIVASFLSVAFEHEWSWKPIEMRHVGNSEFWGALGDWMASRGFRWPHSKHPSRLVLGD
jgi:hypothetical protein